MVRDTAFRLEGILRLRRQRERIASQLFTGARDRADAIDRRIQRLQAALSEHSHAQREAVSAGSKNSALQTDRLTDAIAAEANRLGPANELLRQRREDLLDAMRRRKALDRLKEKRAAAQALRADRRLGREREDTHAAFATIRREAVENESTEPERSNRSGGSAD